MKLAFYFRKYHKWLALIVGVQALIWCLSGLYMTAIHIDIIHGDHLVKTKTINPLVSEMIQPIPETQLEQMGEIQKIKLRQTDQGPVYFIQIKNKLVRLSAVTLDVLPAIDEMQIRTLASKVYAGTHSIQSVELLDEYPRELGGRKQAIWQVVYDDWLASTLYFLPDTGELRSKRTNLWRWFDLLWMLHIMDYEEREDINNNLLRVAASLGLLLTLSGIGLLFYNVKNRRVKQTSFLSVAKTAHKWIALVIGIQLFLWMLSGLMFSLLSHQEVSGNYLIKKEKTVLWQGRSNDLQILAAEFDDVVDIESGRLLAEPVYKIKTSTEEFVVRGSGLVKIQIDEELARKIALARYQGEGEFISIEKQTDTTLETRKFVAPLWHVQFSDQQNSSLYLSAKTGRVFGVKTDTWRIFDIFWMLHIMDYSERNDFNNALVIFSVSVVSFIALTGLILIFSVFSANDFNLLARFKRVPVMIKNNQGFNSEIFASKNKPLYQILSSAGFDLPSNCGGGGSCGLCQVKLGESAAISQADRRFIHSEKLAQGYRLACQLKVSHGLEVELPDQVLQQQIFSCRVIRNEFKTPLIKELILSVPHTAEFTFNAGEYVLVHIPAGETRLDKITVANEYQKFWSHEKIGGYASRRSESITRAYSMANAPADNQQIVLNIRLALPETRDGESGKASSYLFARKAGDEVKVSGSFGHFHANENDRPMVFIGGGAGMAPLRSHILHQLETLKSEREIYYWFGARNTQEIFYQQEFEALVDKYSHFHWYVGLSDSDSEDNCTGFNGMIHEMVEQAYLSKQIDFHQCDFYICGPRPMNKAVFSMLQNHGVGPERIHIDDFGV